MPSTQVACLLGMDPDADTKRLVARLVAESAAARKDGPATERACRELVALGPTPEDCEVGPVESLFLGRYVNGRYGAFWIHLF